MKTRLTVALARKLGYEIHRGHGPDGMAWYADAADASILDRRGPGYPTRRRAVAEAILRAVISGRGDMPAGRSKRHSTPYSRAALWQDVLDRAGVDGARHLDADADRREREVRDK